MNDRVDIVDRLSIVWTSMTDKANAERAEAAAEIERLRNRLLAEETVGDMERRKNEHLQKDRNNLALEIERLRVERDGYLEGNRQTLRALAEANEIAKRYRRERDEARREVCQLMRPDDYNEPFDGTSSEYAAHRGWDCYPKATDARPADATSDG